MKKHSTIKKNDLFDLIHSLTKSEKRYFKVFSTLHSGQKNYLKLFDAIEKQKNPDEERLKKKLAGEALVRNIHVAKKYLLDLLLKSMRSYHSGKLSGPLMEDLLSDMKFLYWKGLTSNCEKLLQKAIETAERSDDLSTSLKLIHWERKLLMGSDADLQNKEKKSDELLKEENGILKKIENVSEYATLSNKILLLHQKEGVARKQITVSLVDKIMKHPLLKNEKQALSKGAREWFYNIYSIAEYIKHDFKKSLEYKEKLLSVIESDEYANNNPHGYIFALHDVLVANCLLNNFNKKFYDTLTKLKSFPFSKYVGKSNQEEIKLKVFSLSVPIELYACKSTGAFTDALKLVPSIEKQLDTYRGKMRDIDLFDIYELLFQICFIVNDLRQAQKWVNKMSTELNNENREDVQAVIRVINLITLYELKKWDDVEFVLRSAYRHLAKNKRLYNFEKSILSFIRNRIPSVGDKTKDASLIFTRLKKELLELMKDPKEAVFAEHFDFISWLDSKIQNRPFAEIVREKVNQNREKTQLN